MAGFSPWDILLHLIDTSTHTLTDSTPPTNPHTSESAAGRHSPGRPPQRSPPPPAETAASPRAPEAGDRAAPSATGSHSYSPHNKAKGKTHKKPPPSHTHKPNHNTP